jgi:hypothetical protein
MAEEPIAWPTIGMWRWQIPTPLGQNLRHLADDLAKSVSCKNSLCWLLSDLGKFRIAVDLSKW